MNRPRPAASSWDRPSRRPLLLVASLAWLAFAIPASARADRETAGRDLLKVHQQKHEQLREQFAASLDKIAETAASNGFRDEAQAIRKLAAPPDPDRLQLEPLPEEVQPEIRLDTPENERAWKSPLRRAQQDYARDLYLLAQRLVNQGHSSYAFQVIREAASHDPDNKSVRGVLGFVRYENLWVTPFRRLMLKDGNVWHDEFGWLKKDQVERYENGERYFKSKWMSARQEAELRRDFKNAWEIRTDHFLVKTNVSQERGVEIAKALEEFHDFFIEAFASFFQSPQQLKKLFGTAAAGTTRPARPHVVHYFATQEEYINKLKLKIPQIGITNGLYFTTDRTAYFFEPKDGNFEGNKPTLFHEATHQLLYEIKPEERAIADREHFWIIEGIACYMESFRGGGNGRISVGDPRYLRFEAARQRYINDKYYIHIQQFSGMGLRDFQSDPNIAKNYSQASGLAHFFMHYDNGRYRDALIEHLTQHYSVTRRMMPMVQGLDELTGVDYPELDRQYGEYCTTLTKNLAARKKAAAGAEAAGN